jgi:ketosteroid isomerase-like protein
MRKLLIALILIALSTGPAVASDQADVMATIHQFIDAFNKGDVKAAVGTCAEQTSIIDEFAPYEWHGAGACAKWAGDYEADAKKNAISDGVVGIGKPKHVDVDGDHAYVVAPVTYAFKMKGKAVRESHSLMTLSLQKAAAGWRITGWAWSKG